MQSPPGCVLNDIHSQLNQTRVSRIESPGTLAELQKAVITVADSGDSLSVMGGRHAMGGQQFLTGGVSLDTRRLDRIVALDSDKGLVQVQAGICWDALVNGLRRIQQKSSRHWSIVQKQTGADRLTIGGALAANGHGRGLEYAPIVQDVESLELVDPQGVVRNCSQTENSELFSLAIGGYGLFGAIYSVTLRLMPAHYLRRTVEVTTVDALEARFAERIAEGFTYGDFQYMTDESSPDFLRRGVLSCYRPVPAEEVGSIDTPRHLLSRNGWQRLLYLSHSDKARAFEEYAGFYRKTDGQAYYSDTFQLSMYIDDYHRDLDRLLYHGTRSSETITEVYVPLPRLAEFMHLAAEELVRRKSEVIYGTIRLIEQDDETFLNWATQAYACIVFNLHFEHSGPGIAKVADDLRWLIDSATDLGGGYFLTYNRFATPLQLKRCYPQFGQFLELKSESTDSGRQVGGLKRQEGAPLNLG